MAQRQSAHTGTAMGFTPTFGDVAGGTTECSVANCLTKCVSWHQAVVLARRGPCWDCLSQYLKSGFSLVAGETHFYSVAEKRCVELLYLECFGLEMCFGAFRPVWAAHSLNELREPRVGGGEG